MAYEANVEISSIYQTIYQSDGNEIFLVDKVVNGGQAGTLSKDSQDKEKDVMMNRMLLCQLLQTLEEDEKKIVKMRFLDERTQTEVAREMNMNQVQVCRQEKKILLKLRELALT